MLILILLSLILGGYSLYLIKKHKEDTFTHFVLFGHRIDELKKKTLYLLDENKESLLEKLKVINELNQKENNTKHQQLVSYEFKKLKSDINKDLDDIVESVKNIKVF